MADQGSREWRPGLGDGQSLRLGGRGRTLLPPAVTLQRRKQLPALPRHEFPDAFGEGCETGPWGTRGYCPPVRAGQGDLGTAGGLRPPCLSPSLSSPLPLTQGHTPLRGSVAGHPGAGMGRLEGPAREGGAVGSWPSPRVLAPLFLEGRGLRAMHVNAALQRPGQLAILKTGDSGAREAQMMEAGAPSPHVPSQGVCRAGPVPICRGPQPRAPSVTWGHAAQAAQSLLRAG